MRKAYYKRTIYYDEEFVKEMDLFEKLIMTDTVHDKIKLQNENLRFSAFIRFMIKTFNEKNQHLLKEKTSNKNAETR